MKRTEPFYYLRLLSTVAIFVLMLLTHASAARAGDAGGKGVNVEAVEKRGVRIWTEKGCNSRYELGEVLNIRVKSRKSGYLTLFDLMPNGEVQILFPNKFQQDNYVEADRIYEIPASADPFRLKISPPRGLDQLLAVVTEEKKKLVREDFSFYSQNFPKLQDSKGEVIQQVQKGVEVIPKESWWAADSCSFSVGSSAAKPVDNQDDQEVDPEDESSQGKLDGRALVIGIDDYSNTRFKNMGRVYRFPSLQYSVKDARKMREVLKEDFREVRLMTDRDATYKGIREGIKNWLAGVEPGETAALYFSGHGAFQTDMDGDDEDGLDEVLVPHDYAEVEKFVVDDELNDWLTGLPAGKVVYIADSCHAGTSSKAVRTFTISEQAKSGTSGVLGDSIGGDLSESASLNTKGGSSKGLVALEASQPSQNAIEDEELKQGVFTHFLIEGLKGSADKDGDGRIAVEELFSFSKQNVLDYTDNEQAPMCSGCDRVKLYLSVAK